MKQPRSQFSLGTFLLLLTVGILAFSHIATSRKLSDARKELKDYRFQYGHLVVDDPTRLHVLQYAELANPWKWHINFPAGKNFKMICGVGIVPTSGVPAAADLQHVQETSISGESENRTMFLSIDEKDSESLKLTIGCDGSQTIAQIIPKADVYAKSVFSNFTVGNGGTFTSAPGESFVIFYRTEIGTNSPGNEGKGIVVWIELVK